MRLLAGKKWHAKSAQLQTACCGQLSSGFAYCCLQRSLRFLVIAYVTAPDMPRLTPLPVVAAPLDFSNDHVLHLKPSGDGSFELVRLLPGETATVAIGLPSAFSGETFSVETLDRGTVTVSKDESPTVSDKRSRHPCLQRKNQLGHLPPYPPLWRRRHLAGHFLRPESYRSQGKTPLPFKGNQFLRITDNY